MQSFPDATRSFRDVGLRAATVMDLEVLVSAVAKELRAARPEVGEPGDVLLGVKVVVWWRWIVDMRAPYYELFPKLQVDTALVSRNVAGLVH